LGCEQVFYENYVTELLPYVKSVKKQMHFRSIVMGVARSVMLFAYAAGVGYGANLMITANLDYGVVFKLKKNTIEGISSNLCVL
jgi:hypothetical protein